MYNKVYFSDGVCVTLPRICASGECSAAVAAHLVWDTVGLQVSVVYTALWDGCRSCFFIQCECLGDDLFSLSHLLLSLFQLTG